MKLQAAVELGNGCGLKTKAECVNNVLMEAMKLFKYDEIKKELKELLDQAKQEGVVFCPKCSFAMLNGDCPMCHGIDLSFRDCV